MEAEIERTTVRQDGVEDAREVTHAGDQGEFL